MLFSITFLTAIVNLLNFMILSSFGNGRIQFVFSDINVKNGRVKIGGVAGKFGLGLNGNE